MSKIPFKGFLDLASFRDPITAKLIQPPTIIPQIRATTNHETKFSRKIVVKYPIAGAQAMKGKM